MKAIKSVFVAALTAVVLMLTSCIGDGNTTGSGSGVGMIIVNDANKPIWYGTGDYPFYSDEIYQYYILNGDKQYLSIAYSYDLDDPQNANYTQNGYVVANTQILLSESNGMVKAMAQQAILDNTLNTNEVKPGGLDIYLFLEYKLLTAIGITNYTKDDTVYYYMTYDPDQEPGTSGNLKVYDVYIRMIHNVTGTGSADADVVVFDMNSAVNSFKQVESGSSFYIRVNYASTIEDEEVSKWASYPTLLEVANK
ncbi:MAG: hypothetical protein LUH10_18445 [Tannerellaceae bacterium]|nr:hypothetical protein [Tannerellaceae bacterium]